MENIATDILQLLNKLSGIKSRENVIKLFVDEINHLSDEFNIEYSSKLDVADAASVPITTDGKVSGLFIIHGNTEDVDIGLFETLKYSMDLLSVILENITRKEQIDFQKNIFIDEFGEKERTILESQEKYRITLDSIGDAVIATDKNGCIDFMNPIAELLTGWNEEDAIGMALEKVFVIENANTGIKIKNPVEEVLKTGRVIGLANHTKLTSKDGRQFQISDSAAPIIDSDQEISGVVLVFRDVTEKYNIREKLKRSEERFTFAMEATKDGIWDWNIPKNEVYYSHGYLAILGYTEEEFGNSEDSWKDSIHPDDFDKVMKANIGCIEGLTESFEVESRIKRKDGSYVWILGRGKVVERDANGKAIRMVGTHADISDLKERENELFEAKEFLETALAASASGVIIADAPDCKIRMANSAAFNIRGGDREMLTGIDVSDHSGKWQTYYPDGSLYNPEELPLSRAIINGESVKGEELVIRDENGNDHWVLSNAAPILNIEGDIIAGIVIFTDITDRKRIERSLKLSEEKFRKAFQISPDAININRLSDGLYIDINDGFEKITGYSRAEIIGKTSIDKNIWKNPDNREKMVNIIRENGSVSNMEAQFAMKDGSIRTGLISASVFDSGEDVYILNVTRDITDRKKIEEQLIESERRLRSYIENSPQGIFIADEKGQYIEVNPAAEEITGYSEEELLNMNLLEIIVPDNLEKAENHFRKVVEEGKATEEIAFIRKGGSLCWWVVSAVKLSHNRFMAFVTDTTEQKKAEKLLIESENRYRTIFESTGTAMMIVDSDTSIIMANNEIIKVTGYLPYELIGNSWTKYVVPEYLELMKKNNAARLTNKESVPSRYSVKMINKFGETRDALLNVKVVPKTSLTVVSILDITEMTEAENALKESEEKYRALVDTAPYGIQLADVNGKIIFSNPAHHEIHGYNYPELIGKYIWELLADENEKIQLEQYYNYLMTEQPQPVVYFGKDITKDNKIIITQVNWDYSHDNKGNANGTISIVSDITDKVKAEDELKTAKDFAENIIETANTIIVTLDKNATITTFNKYAENLTGYKKSEVIGKNWLEIFLPDSMKSEIPVVFEDVLNNSPEVSRYENPIKVKSGEEKLINWNNNITRDNSGNITGVLSIGMDITEKKRIEQDLKESQERFLLAMKASRDGLFDWDLITNDIYYSPGWKSMLGYEYHEIENKFSVWEELTEPVDRLNTLDEMNWHLQGKTKRFEVEFRMKHKAGHWVEILSRAFAIRDENGKPYRVVGTHVDISEMKKVQRALLENEEKLRQIIDLVPHLIFAKDINGKFIIANKAVADLYGTTTKEIVGKKDIDFNPNEDEADYFISEDRKVIENKVRDYKVEEQITDSSGNTKTLQTTKIPFKTSDTEVPAVLGVSVDITERIEAENKVRESEEKYRLLLYNQTDLVVKVDTQGRFLFVSPSYCETFGKKEEELLGQRFMPLVHEDDIESTLNEMKKLYSPPYHVTIRQRAKTINGWKWFEWADSAVLDDNNEVIEIIGTGRDISRRVEAQEALKESEERFRSIFEMSISPICIADLDESKFLVLNPAFEKILGFSENEMVGHEFNEFIHPDDIEKTNQIVAEDLQKGKSVFNFENRYRCKDGSYRVFDWMSYPKPEQGLIYAVAHDMTDVYAAQEVLKESEDKLRNLFRKLPVGVVLSNNRTILSINDAFAEMVGYNENEIIGMNTRIFYPDEESYQHVGELISNLIEKEVVEHEIPMKSKSGRIMTLNYIATSMRKNDPESDIISIFEDITRKKRIQEELQKISKLESLGVIAGGIAHNFKNMLTSMSLSVEIARLKPMKAKAYLDKIMRSIEQAAALATRFQTFSKSGSPVLKKEDINMLLNESADMAVKGSNVFLNFDLAPDLLPGLIDPKQINEVIMNLVLNADQAMPGGGKIFIRSANEIVNDNQIANLERGKYVKIEIEDEGLGIPAKYLEDIFTPFFTTKDKGHGLGLASVHFIVQKHNGAIQVESAPGLGTKFTIYLPAAEPKEDGQAENVDDNSGFHNNPKIMLMDDDEQIRDIINDLLSLEDCDICLAEGPESAIECFTDAYQSDEPFDITILDLTIVGSSKSGLDVLNDLKKIDPDIKAIVFSGHSVQPVVANYEEFGFVGRIEKPVTYEALISEINRVARL